MNRFKIEIGDPSNDGHGKSESFVVNCNYTMGDIQTAYTQACALTGLVFTENTDVMVNGEKMNWQHPEYNARKICVEYESWEPSDLAWNILEEHGIDKMEGMESEEFLDLFMQFISLILSDLEYNLEEDYLDVLNLTIGYGRFE